MGEEKINLSLTCEGEEISTINGQTSVSQVRPTVVIKNGVISGIFGKGKTFVTAEKIDGVYGFNDNDNDKGDWALLMIDRLSGKMSKFSVTNFGGTKIIRSFEGYCKSGKPKF